MKRLKAPKMNNKGQSMDLLFTVLGAMAVLSILAIVVFTINSEARTDLVTNTPGCNATSTTSCGYAYNSTVDIDEGQSNITERAPLIGLIAGFAVVLSIAGILFVTFRR